MYVHPYVHACAHRWTQSGMDVCIYEEGVEGGTADSGIAAQFT